MAIWQSIIAICSLVICHSLVAKKVIWVREHVSLNTCWRFRLCFIAKYVLSIWRHTIALRTLTICSNLLLNIYWQFWRPLIARKETIELVTLIRLEGVNYVFSSFFYFSCYFLILVFSQNC